MVEKICEALHAVLFWVLWSVWVLGATITGLLMLYQFQSGNGVPWTLLPSFLTQVVGAILGLLNRGVKNLDRRVGVSLIPPLCYLAVALIAPHGVNDVVSIVFSIAGSALVLAGFWSLRHRFTCARCNWDGLVSTGVFRYVRHPQATGVMLQILAVGSMSGETVRTAVGVALVLWHIWIEEGYLSQFREWRDYARYVPPFLPRLREVGPSVRRKSLEVPSDA